MDGLPRDIILYRVKYVTARLNLNPYDFSKFRRRRDRLASGQCFARTITRGPLLDTVSRNATRFIVFDSLNAYNFGARLVGNVVDSLGCT